MKEWQKIVDELLKIDKRIRKLLEKEKDKDGEFVGKGIYIGVKYRKGKKIHIGDKLKFDELEWGDTHNEFYITLENGEIVGKGTPTDWTDWCEVINEPVLEESDRLKLLNSLDNITTAISFIKTAFVKY